MHVYMLTGTYSLCGLTQTLTVFDDVHAAFNAAQGKLMTVRDVVFQDYVEALSLFIPDFDFQTCLSFIGKEGRHVVQIVYF